MTTAPSHNYILAVDFLGDDLWVATAHGVSHGIRLKQKEAGKMMNIPEALAAAMGATAIKKTAVSAPDALNEACDYERPSSFSRGLRLDFGSVAMLLISGTASVGADGETLFPGDFRAQTRRTFANITALLESEGASWKDVVRTTCYLRDIERDYAAFNEERTAFYGDLELDPLPASTGIQAILCRPDLLVEIEAIAIFLAGGARKE